MLEYDNLPNFTSTFRRTSSGMLCAIAAVLYVAIALITALTA